MLCAPLEFVCAKDIEISIEPASIANHPERGFNSLKTFCCEVRKVAVLCGGPQHSSSHSSMMMGDDRVVNKGGEHLRVMMD